jgi:uncharacterized protein (DUF4213/DUF364 family)
MNQQVPLWVAIALAAGSPILSLVGVLIAQLFSGRVAGQTDKRQRREETMRTLRWAADLAASIDVSKAAVGIAALNALDKSTLLDTDDQKLITAVLESVLSLVVQAYDEDVDFVEEEH